MASRLRNSESASRSCKFPLREYMGTTHSRWTSVRRDERDGTQPPGQCRRGGSLEASRASSQRFPPTLSSLDGLLSLAFDRLNFSSSQHQLGLDLLQQVPSSADRQQTDSRTKQPLQSFCQNRYGPKMILVQAARDHARGLHGSQAVAISPTLPFRCASPDVDVGPYRLGQALQQTS